MSDPSSYTVIISGLNYHFSITLLEIRPIRVTTTEFGVVTLIGNCMFLGINHAPSQGRQGSSAPTLWGFHLCLHPWRRTIKFCVITRMWELSVLVVSHAVAFAQCRAVCQR